MKFCTKCGRQLEDGEVCNCQQEQNTEAAAADAAAAKADAEEAGITAEDGAN